MILFDLSNSEAHPAYQALAISNGDRQFSFLQSVVNAALESGQPFLSQTILKALNFHAIACLHTNAGEYRPCPVYVPYPDPVDNFQTPEHYRVGALMDNFINFVNSSWHRNDPVVLAAFVLWRLCAIHPFINGNGRTARAAAYFIICVSSGGWLPGTENMITLLKKHPGYTAALKAADASANSSALDLTALAVVVGECLQQQITSATPAT